MKIQWRSFYTQILLFVRIKWKWFVAGIFLGAFTLMISLGIYYVHWYINIFTTHAETSFSNVIQILQQGWEREITQTHERKNILILGVDSLETRPGSPPLTDTIILVSIQTETPKIYLVSFPRDLWSPEYQTKINALYAYGHQRYPQKPEQFTQEVLNTYTGLDIHHTVVLDLQTMATIIDAVEGIDVEIQQGFIDTKFPRTDVDVTQVTDETKLYKTIEFKQGTEHMNGERALEYIRSRHSEDITQGTDDARAQRQQHVIHALIDQVASTQIVRHPEKAGKLYNIYQNYFEQYIPLSEVIALGKSLGLEARQITLQTHSLSIQTEENEGVLIHPPTNTYGQWVYEIQNKEVFKKEVREKLNI